MIVKFKTVNKKAHSSEIERMVYAKMEEEIKVEIRERLRRAKEELEGLDLLVEIDMQNSSARLIGDGIPEDRIEIAKSAMQKMK